MIKVLGWLLDLVFFLVFLVFRMFTTGVWILGL